MRHKCIKFSRIHKKVLNKAFYNYLHKYPIKEKNSTKFIQKLFSLIEIFFELKIIFEKFSKDFINKNNIKKQERL